MANSGPNPKLAWPLLCSVSARACRPAEPAAWGPVGDINHIRRGLVLGIMEARG